MVPIGRTEIEELIFLRSKISAERIAGDRRALLFCKPFSDLLAVEKKRILLFWSGGEKGFVVPVGQAIGEHFIDIVSAFRDSKTDAYGNLGQH